MVGAIRIETVGYQALFIETVGCIARAAIHLRQYRACFSDTGTVIFMHSKFSAFGKYAGDESSESGRVDE